MRTKTAGRRRAREQLRGRLEPAATLLLPRQSGVEGAGDEGVLINLINLIMLILIQVLRDKIGTAMTNKKSRADQFSLIIHGQGGEGSD